MRAVASVPPLTEHLLINDFLKLTLKINLSINEKKMTKKIILIVILVMGLVFGMAVISCDDGSTNNNDSSIISGADTLNLSGRVFLRVWDYDEVNDVETHTYQNYTDSNLTVYTEYGGNGIVSNGNLKFSIGKPTELYTIDFEDVFLTPNSDGSLSKYNPVPNNIRGVLLERLVTDSDSSLSKENSTRIVRNNGSSFIEERVVFLYVENNVTITGTGETETNTYEADGVTETWTHSSENFTLALKAGWNAIHFKFESSYTVNVRNPIRVTSTRTETISLRNPDLKWVLYLPKLWP